RLDGTVCGAVQVAGAAVGDLPRKVATGVVGHAVGAGHLELDRFADLEVVVEAAVGRRREVGRAARRVIQLIRHNDGRGDLPVFELLDAAAERCPLARGAFTASPVGGEGAEAEDAGQGTEPGG